MQQHPGCSQGVVCHRVAVPCDAWFHSVSSSLQYKHGVLCQLPPTRIHHAGSILTAGCLAAIGAVMAVSMPASPQPPGASKSSKQLPLLVALLSIYSVVAEASIGGLSITGKHCRHPRHALGAWPVDAPD